MAQRSKKHSISDYRRDAKKRDKALAYLIGRDESERRRENQNDQTANRTRYAHG